MGHKPLRFLWCLSFYVACNIFILFGTISFLKHLDVYVGIYEKNVM